MQSIGKGALRVAKNYAQGYSDTQSRVREATSNDPRPPSGGHLHEIAQLTYNTFVIFFFSSTAYARSRFSHRAAVFVNRLQERSDRDPGDLG
jgi:hypothetical protein